MKRIAVLGSTGSIGTQTLEIIREQQDMMAVALAAASNIELLESQIREFNPKIAAVYDEKAAKELAVRVADLDVKVCGGMEGLLEIAVMPEMDTLVTAIVGMVGIVPTIEAIKAKKTIALANKETLVTAGHLIMPLAKQHHVMILPVDSEHSALFQALNGEKKEQAHHLIITASGGPFRTKSKEELYHVRLADALRHPNWSMGAKITIDSATMVNKGLEVMEARWLFDMELSKIQVVVHPQSVIHSMVEFQDGAVIAQLGVPDMKLPIQYALSYPDRRFLDGERLDFAKLGQMTFEEPDLQKFEGFALSLQAAKAGGSMPVVFNAANERAVAKFLREEIGFMDIPAIIRDCMEAHQKIENPSVEQILALESETYDRIESRW